MIKKTIYTLLVLITTLCVQAQTTQRLLSPDSSLSISFLFYETLPNNGEYFAQKPDSNQWTYYLSGDIPSQIQQPERTYIFKSYFYIDSSIQNTDLSLLAGSYDFPCIFFLNGKQIGRVGSFKELYRSQIYTAKSFYLPSDYLHYGQSGEPNELTIQGYPKQGETRTLDNMSIASYSRVETATFIRNFIGIHLVQASVVFTTILFLYFMFGFFMKRDRHDLKYFYFALFCFFFALGYSNMAFAHDTFPQLALAKMSRVGLSMANLFLLYLTLSFTKKLSDKKTLKIALAIPSILFALVILLQTNVGALEKIFTTFVTIVNLPYMLFAFVVAIVATVQKPDIQKITFLTGFVFMVGTIFYDSYEFTQRLIPYTWTIPHGYTLFISSVFFILAYEQTAIYHLSLDQRDELQGMTDNLEDLVKQRTAQVEQQNEELTAQSEYLKELNTQVNTQNEELTTQSENMQSLNTILESRNVEVNQQKFQLENLYGQTIDSINYARRIQQAILPDEQIFADNLKEYFVLYKPKDIVSGDFYWFKRIRHYIVFAVADCTGHGVPGAFMSMLGVSFLNEIISRRDVKHTGQTLDILREQIKSSLRQTGKRGEQQDGLDIALCIWDTQTNLLQFSGANSPLCLVRKDTDSNNLKDIAPERMRILKKDGYQLIQFMPDIQPIGIYRKETPFKSIEINLLQNDTLYLFTDGFADQMGGRLGQKYMKRKLKELLLHIHKDPMPDQQEVLTEITTTWMGDKKQMDDILMMGIRV